MPSSALSRTATTPAPAVLKGPPLFSCPWTDGQAGAAWVKPVGDLDLCTTSQLDQSLRAAQLAADRVVLDLRGVSFLDSSAYHAIVDASVRARSTGGRLTVVRGPRCVQLAFARVGNPEDVEMVDLDPRQPPVQALLMQATGSEVAA